MMQFTIPCEMIDLNSYIRAERSNRFKAAKIKADETTKAMLYCRCLKLPEKTQFNVEFYWTTKDRKKDSDNIYFAAKFILDGVVEAKKIENDTYKFIKNIAHFRDIGDIDCVTVVFKPV